MSYSAIIEITANTYPVKYEINNGKLTVDRVLSTSMLYPGHYGYIENTLADDGDPLDVIIYAEFPIMPTARIMFKPLGVLIMEDEKGMDEKILAVPDNTVCMDYNIYNNYTDLPQSIINKTKHFFEKYKDLDDNKWVKVGEILDAENALNLIKKYSL